MISKRYNIKNWTRQNLSDWFKKNEISSSSVKSFRADQLFNWLYQKRVESFDQMLNIGQETRELLEDHFYISSLKVADKLQSSDGSIKFRILLMTATVLNQCSCLTRIIIPYVSLPKQAVQWAVISV